MFLLKFVFLIHQICCKLHKHYQYQVQFHVQRFFSKQVATVQSNFIIYFQESFEIPPFCKYIHVHHIN